jgi:hypothetical protein
MLDRPWLLSVGGLIGAVGYGLLSRLGARSTLIEMLPGFVLIPAGMGLAVPAMTTAILSSVDRGRSGTASAVLNTARQVGGANGVAAFGALVSGVTNEQIISGLNTAVTSSVLLINRNDNRPVCSPRSPLSEIASERRPSCDHRVCSRHMWKVVLNDLFLCLFEPFLLSLQP